MFFGVIFGVMACFLWGFVYLIPLALPQYDPMLIAAARYIGFGVVAGPLIWFERHELKTYTLADWWYVTKLGVIGNIVYYWILSSCIQKSGAPLAGMCMALIPVLVAIISNWRDARAGNGRSIGWAKLMPGLLMLLVGIVLANWTEFGYIVESAGGSSGEFWLGAVLGVVALLLWTWYPIRNADWLLAHPERKASAWSTAQGLVSLPFSVILYGFVWGAVLPADTPFLGADPVWFLFLTFSSGIVCSWCGILCWNAMSQRLPTALGGQMIVFETVFAVIYAHIYRAQWPTVSMVAGLVMLIAGVLYSLNVFNKNSVSVCREPD